MRKSWMLRLKRITALLLCVAMMMSVAGCKKGDPTLDEVMDEPEVTAQQEETVSAKLKGVVSAIQEENGAETNVPVRDAVISVYIEDQKTPVKIIRMNSQKDDFFEVNLPVGIYSFVTEAEGYITSTTTFELTSEKEAYLEIVLEAAFVPEPETVPEPEVVLVTDTYAETVADCTFRIPQINLSVGDAAQINEEIYNALYPVVEASVNEIAETGYPFTSDEVSYYWSANEDILSLVIKNHSWPDASPRYVYTVYNVSVSTGMEMADAELIAAAGLTEAEFYERAKEAIGSAFWDGWDPTNGNFSSQAFLDMFNECLDQSISDENIEEGFLYMNEQGQLCIIAKKYAFAGPAYTWCDVNLIEYELSPYYES